MSETLKKVKLKNTKKVAIPVLRIVLSENKDKSRALYKYC